MTNEQDPPRLPHLRVVSHRPEGSGDLRPLATASTKTLPRLAASWMSYAEGVGDPATAIRPTDLQLASLQHGAAAVEDLASPLTDDDLDWLMGEMVILADMWKVALPKGPALKKFIDTLAKYPRHLLEKAIAAVCDEYAALKRDGSRCSHEQRREEFRRELEQTDEAMRQAHWAKVRGESKT